MTLTVLLLLGVSALQTGLLTEKIARNRRDRAIALLAAEAALLDAEYDIGNPASPRYARIGVLLTQPAAWQADACSTAGGDRGICILAAGVARPSPWQRISLKDKAKQRGTAAAGVAYGSITGRSMQTGHGMLPALPPRYLIDILPRPSVDVAATMLRISAIAYGPDTGTTVLLQSVYVRPVRGSAAAGEDSVVPEGILDGRHRGRIGWRELAPDSDAAIVRGQALQHAVAAGHAVRNDALS